MFMALATFIGSLAAFLTTVCFIPQVLLVVRKRQTAGISLTMYLLFATGLALWLTYGILIHSWPIIIANSVTLCLAAVIIVMKVRLG